MDPRWHVRPAPRRRGTLRARSLRAVAGGVAGLVLLTVPGAATAAPADTSTTATPAPAAGPDTAPAAAPPFPGEAPAASDEGTDDHPAPPPPVERPAGDQLAPHEHEDEGEDESVEMVVPVPTDGLQVGDEVVGAIVRVADGPAHGPTTYVETAAGDLIPVQHDALDVVPVASTVSVVLGQPVPVPVDAAETTFAERTVTDVQVLDRAPAQPALAPASAEAAAEAAAETLTNQVTLVMVLPAGATADTATPAQAAAVIDGIVADYWRRESNGAVRLGVVATHDWLTSAKNCSDSTIWTETAGRIGWTSGAGKHLALYFPYGTPNCGSAIGLGTIGSGTTTGGRVWSAGGLEPHLWDVWAHEFGHNFGLSHANRTDCVGALETGTCATQVYADPYDIMGYSGQDRNGALNVVHAARLGFLPADQQRTLASSGVGGTYALVPVSQRNGIRGVRLTTSTGATYWLEYRTASGADSWIGEHWSRRYRDYWYQTTYGISEGVVLRRAGAGSPGTSNLFDATPPTSTSGFHTNDQVALPVGTPVPVAGGAFTVTVQSTAVGEATLHIATATTPPAPAATAIQTAYEQQHAATGMLGLATGPETCTLSGGGCTQPFQHGTFYSTAGTGARYVVPDTIGTTWAQQGGPTGRLGYPTTDPQTGYDCYTYQSRCTQTFQHGTYHWASGRPARALTPPMSAAYTAAGGMTGTLGMPTADTDCTLPGGGCVQTYTNGSAHYSAPGATAAWLIRDDRIGRAWRAAGGPGSPLGYPTASADTASACSNGQICTQRFEKGTYYWTPDGGTRGLRSLFATAYETAGGPAGALGHPTADTNCSLPGGGCAQTYTYGGHYQAPGTGTPVLVRNPLDARFRAGGGPTGPLGYPTGVPSCIDANCKQPFQNGLLYQVDGAARVVLPSAITDTWNASGAETGRFGWPISEETCTAAGLCSRTFTGGTIHGSSTETYTVEDQVGGVPTGFGSAWRNLGGAAGTLGGPAGNATCAAKGCTQSFAGGVLVKRADQGAPLVLTGHAITSYWTAPGGDALGLPTGDRRCDLAAAACSQVFDHGTVYWSTATGAHAVRAGDPLGDRWTASGGVTGTLGYPTGDAVCVGSGCTQAFRGGTIAQAAGGAPATVAGPIRDRWTASGGAAGALGYPTTDTACTTSGCAQPFTGGSIYSSARGGTRVVAGVLLTRYAALRGHTGALGYPTTEAACGLRNGGCRQSFAGGALLWSARTGARTVTGTVLARYAKAGYEKSPLGYPTADTRTGLRNRGSSQAFTGGSIFASPRTGARIVTRAIRTRYLSLGAQNSRYGYPTGEAYRVRGGLAQRFQGGTLTHRGGTVR